MSERRPGVSDPQIREARLEDAPVLTELLIQLGFPASVDEIERRLTALLSAGEAVLIAVLNGETVGLVTVHITPVLHRPTAVGRLTALVVSDRVRRSGVGAALVRAAERLVAGRGCAMIEVTSHRRLVEAHAFYERLGYEVTSFRFRKSLRPSMSQSPEPPSG